MQMQLANAMLLRNFRCTEWQSRWTDSWKYFGSWLSQLIVFPSRLLATMFMSTALLRCAGRNSMGCMTLVDPTHSIPLEFCRLCGGASVHDKRQLLFMRMLVALKLVIPFVIWSIFDDIVAACRRREKAVAWPCDLTYFCWFCYRNGGNPVNLEQLLAPPAFTPPSLDLEVTTKGAKHVWNIKFTFDGDYITDVFQDMVSLDVLTFSFLGFPFEEIEFGCAKTCYRLMCLRNEGQHFHSNAFLQGTISTHGYFGWTLVLTVSHLNTNDSGIKNAWTIFHIHLIGDVLWWFWLWFRNRFQWLWILMWCVWGMMDKATDSCKARCLCTGAWDEIYHMRWWVLLQRGMKRSQCRSWLPPMLSRCVPCVFTHVGCYAACRGGEGEWERSFQLQTCRMLRNLFWMRGDDRNPCTCTHVGCYATGLWHGGDDHVPFACTHVGC